MFNSKSIILDCVCDLKSRVCDLFSSDFEEIFNRVNHGLDETGVKQLLSEMYNDGYIEFLHDQEKVQLKEKISPAEINPQWYLSLTEKGGMLWESIYQPNWDLYIGVDSEFPTDDDSVETVIIRAGSLKALQGLLKKVQRELNYKEISPLEPLPAWNPTYWKSLSRGCTVTLLGGEEFSEGLGRHISHINWRKINKL